MTQVGVQLRRRPQRGPRGHEEPARRQGGQPRRDGLDRPAGAARLHHHHRGLHRLLREQPATTRRAAATGPRRPGRDRESGRPQVRRTGSNPLLVSVRSGARVSMPGMMDTVLNLGLNDVTVEGLAAAAERCPLRLGQLPPLHPDVRLGGAGRGSPPVRGDHRAREAGHRRHRGHRADARRTGSAWSDAYKDMVAQETGKPFPQDPQEQLWGAIGAVFGSWMNHRAITYRRLHDIPAEWGTAVNVQAMVFGNMGDDCATGVCFTRDPSTGENAFYGEYLVNAQGEDVVAGIRTPQPMSKAQRQAGRDADGSGDAGRLCRAAAGARDAGAALPRHAGHRVHGPAAQAVHAADPQRQAHRRRPA